MERSPSRALLVFAIVCGIALAGVWVLTLWRSHDRALAAAEAVSTRITLQIQEHAARSFSDVQLLAERVREQLERGNIPDGGHGRDKGFLDGYVRALPQVAAVAVFSRSGQIVTLSGRQEGLAALNSHDFFPLFWSAQRPKMVRLTQGPSDTVNLAYVQSLIGNGGEFLGALVAMIDLDYFQSFYRRVDLGPRGVIGLAAHDGGILVRHPMPQDRGSYMRSAGAQAPARPLARELSPVDGIDRVMASAEVPPLPLKVYAGLATADVLAPWRTELAEGAGIAVGVGLLLLVLGRLAWSAARGREELLGRLEQALCDKATLFTEMHHRVKNNLQIVSSMVTVQSLQTTDDGVSAALKQLSTRIQSMSMLHQTLYENDQAEDVDLAGLLEKILRNLTAAYAPDGRIRTRVDVCGAAPLDQALPIALIANEVVSNAFKHAFPDGRRGCIDITLRHEDEAKVLVIKDDGVGLEAAPQRPGSMGTTLIASLASQIGARIETLSDRGTEFRLVFAGAPARGRADRVATPAAAARNREHGSAGGRHPAPGR